jgi:hypothetical protein
MSKVSRSGDYSGVYGGNISVSGRFSKLDSRNGKYLRIGSYKKCCFIRNYFNYKSAEIWSGL